MKLDISVLGFDLCADSALRFLYGQRLLTKHADPDAPQCYFHGDESKPEMIGALFKPL